MDNLDEREIKKAKKILKFSILVKLFKETELPILPVRTVNTLYTKKNKFWSWRFDIDLGANKFMAMGIQTRCLTVRIPSSSTVNRDTKIYRLKCCVLLLS